MSWGEGWHFIRGVGGPSERTSERRQNDKKEPATHALGEGKGESIVNSLEEKKQENGRKARRQWAKKEVKEGEVRGMGRD